MGYKKPELNSGSEEWRAQLEKIEAEYPLVQHTGRAHLFNGAPDES
jgi:hypothetical protein